MDELIEFAEPGRVDLLKMDIEGSECGVLSASARKWLGRVHNMVIELHDDNCSAAFETALADYRYKMLRAGDLVVARNILPRLPAVRGGVSIVIPAFNAEDFLEAAVESVIAQIPTEWDLTIVNDGSVDSTPSLADALATRDSRIRVIHQPNRGLALSRNYGLAASDPAHEFVLFLDADDQLQPGAFDALLKLAHEHPESAACHGAARRVDASGRPLESSGNGATRMALTGRRAMPAGEDGPTTRQMLVVQNCILSAGSVLVRKDALDRIGAFDAAISETSDHDLWYRLSDLGPLEFTPQVVLSYQVREASMSSHHRLMRRSSLSMRRRWFRQASGIARTTVVLGYREYLRLLARGQRALIRNLIAQRRFLRVFLEIPRVAYRTIKTMPVIPSLILRAGRAFNPD